MILLLFRSQTNTSTQSHIVLGFVFLLDGLSQQGDVFGVDRQHVLPHLIRIVHFLYEVGFLVQALQNASQDVVHTLIIVSLFDDALDQRLFALSFGPVLLLVVNLVHDDLLQFVADSMVTPTCTLSSKVVLSYRPSVPPPLESLRWYRYAGRPPYFRG